MANEVAAQNQPSRYQQNHRKAWNREDRLYRLRIVDLDGSIAFSPLRRVRFQEGIDIAVFPNPAKGQITIVNATLDEGWRLYSSLGQEISVVASMGASGMNMYFEGIPSGLYFLRDKSGRTKRIVISD